MAGIAAPSSALSTAFGIAALVVFLSWVLLFAILLGAYAAIIISRKGRRASPASAGAMLGAGPAAEGGPALAKAPPEAARTPRASWPPAGLEALRRADPAFDEQLLLDAAQTATLLMFAAVATGDEAPVSRVVADSYWHTPQGRTLRTVARDRRTEAEFAARNSRESRARQQTVPVDYQAAAAELTAVGLGSQQEVHVRVAFDQLAAIVRPGAEALAAGAAATSLTSGFASLGMAVVAQAADGSQSSVSWVGGGGHYDLTFVRPADATTDPAAALADRICPACGATYRSELATACQHCGAGRPEPWGHWRLASVDPAS